MNLQSILSRSRNSSLNFRVVLCRFRLFPTLVSTIKWLGSGLPLKCFPIKISVNIIFDRVGKKDPITLASEIICDRLGYKDINIMLWSQHISFIMVGVLGLLSKLLKNKQINNCAGQQEYLFTLLLAYLFEIIEKSGDKY